jgi:hypothetical protein
MVKRSRVLSADFSPNQRHSFSPPQFTTGHITCSFPSDVIAVLLPRGPFVAGPCNTVNGPDNYSEAFRQCLTVQNSADQDTC